jgi:hypothetical protein
VANNVFPVGPPNQVPSPFTLTPTSGRISTTGTLAAGTYAATGTTSDANSDAGTWTYTLHVYTPAAGTIAQTEPTSRTVTTTDSSAFADQLAVTGTVGTVTYTQSTGGTSLKISSSGLVGTTGSLPAGTYSATGTTTDINGDTGTWTYSLYVGTAGTIVQSTPTSGTVTTTGSAAFTDQLAVTGNVGTVAYTQSTGNPGITIFSLPATNAPVVLTIAMMASSGNASTAVSVPLRSAITALDTVFAAGPGTCMAGLG